MNVSKRALGLVAIVAALVLCNGIQGSIDLYRHFPAPQCPLTTPHQHGPDVPGCEKWGEAYGPRMDWIEAMKNFNKLHGEGWDLEAFSVIIVGGIMGGFRQLATTVLWMKSDEYWHAGKADRMIPILRAVTWLDPNFLDGWRIAGWHWAYNLYAQAGEDYPKKMLCLNQGLNFLKEGIVWNQNSSELHFELAWTYYDKAGDYQSAIRWFTETRKKPDYKKNYRIDTAQHMLSHAYERTPDIHGALRGYETILRLTPEEKAALIKWVDFKRRYRETKRLVKMWNAYHPVVPKLDNAKMPDMPGMPPGAKPPQMPPPPKPKPNTKYFPECQHALRPNWNAEDIKQIMPDIEKWKQWVEFDGAAYAYEAAKRDNDTATMSLIKYRIPDIEEALAILPIVRKIETREAPAPGAAITLRLRYLEAWELFKQKKYEEARESLLKTMELEPEEATFPIGHHLLARIYEAQYEQSKDRKFLEKAYNEGWVESARHNQMNRLAHAQVYNYQAQYDMPKVSVKKLRETTPDTFRTPGGGPQQHQPHD
jgi:tetratricopeptide (TPR) repeat protein